MPTHERLGTDDRDGIEDRWKPSIQLDKEHAIVVRKPGPALHLTPQNDQLMSERRILCFKPALRLEWRGQDGQDEAEQRKHCALTLGDSFSRSNADEVFGTHRWIADEIIPSIKLGGARLVAKADLERLLSPSPDLTEEPDYGSN